MPNIYECSLSGVRAEGEFNFDKDNMGDLPVGWVQVTVKRRSFNPQWISIQQAKDTAVKVMLASIPRNTPAEVRAMQENMVRMQQEAQYFAMEKETPVYITTEEIIYIADPVGNEELAGAFNEARAALGLDPMAEEEADLAGGDESRSSGEAEDDGEDEDGDEDQDEDDDDDE